MKLTITSSLLLSISGASAIPANCRRNCEIVFFTLRDINTCIERRCGGAELQLSSNALQSCDSLCEKVFSTPGAISSCKSDHCQNSKHAKKAGLRGIESSPDKNDVDLGILEADVPTFVATTNSAKETEGYINACYDYCHIYAKTSDEYLSCIESYCYSRASKERSLVANNESDKVSFIATKESARLDAYNCLDVCFFSTKTAAQYYACVENICSDQCLDECFYSTMTPDNCVENYCDFRVSKGPSFLAAKGSEVSCQEICEIAHPGMPEAADNCKAACPN